eukprot:GHVS01045149.1.p1 GENE.GHVS01045149.1~~GHVS01045149.1.p1  ORF type:complete len:280 (-),score=32.88 GHVS01045149.1:222-1061(-)
MEFYRFCTGLVMFLLFTGIHGTPLLRDRRGLQSWQASMEARSCEELRELCEMSFEEVECVVTSSVCYEMLQCKPEAAARCAIEWSKILQTYDRELFTEVQAIMWSFFALRPEAQQSFVKNITSSISTADGGSVMERSVKLFDSLAKVLPVVESDLIIQFNSTAWEGVMKKFQQSPEEMLQKIEVPQIGASRGVTGEGNGLMSQFSSVFVLPDGFSFGQFMSTIKWNKGLLENLGLDYGSFNQIVESFSDEQGSLEDLASDLGLLVKNVHGLRKIAAAVA